MTSFRILAAALLMAPVHSAFAADEPAGIEIGIAPFLPVKVLIQNYAPLRDHLQKRLHAPVTIVSAPDYRSYIKCLEKHDYPIIIAGAGAAWLAWTEYGYVPLLRPLVYTRPVLVVSRNSALTQIKDLRGKTVAMSDKLSIVAIHGLRLLREAGLEPGRDVIVKNMQNQSAAANLVLAGEAAAAILSDRAMLQMPALTKDNLTLVHSWNEGGVPGIVYLGSPLVPRDRIEQISREILAFTQGTPEGKQLMKELGYGGLAPVSEEELSKLAPYGASLKETLSN